MVYTKKLLIVLLLVIQSCAVFAQHCCEARAVCCERTAFEGEFPAIENDIRQLYDNEVFCTTNTPDFKMSEICTEGFIQRLTHANDHDGAGYATWLLRSGMQDGQDVPSRVLSVRPGPGNTVIVNWTDMGLEGSTTFSMVKSGGRWKIDGATVPEGYNPL